MARLSVPFLLPWLLVVMGTALGDKQYVIRETGSGRVGGLVERVLDREVAVFLGVPFARPPVGELRFRRPEPAPKWSHVINATNFPAACYQEIDDSFGKFEGVDMWNPNTQPSEDCLYLNVWQPVTGGSTPAAPKAVMVWIYGGGFASGTSTLNLYDGRILAAKGNVVVVSMQYRVGVLGFLYLGIPEAPGNQGLLDQQLALKWVHDNIRQFGGDPGRVTVFGESAGACSVGLHLLSPLSRDLVRAGIMQSASAVAPWGVDAPEVAKMKATTVAKQLGCTSKRDRDSVRCLQNVRAADVISAQQKIEYESLDLPFVATVDNHFLTEDPRDTLKRKDIGMASSDILRHSILLGVNRDEGYYFLAYQDSKYFFRNPTPEPVTPEVYQSLVSRSIVVRPEERAGVSPDLVAFEYGSPYFSKDSAQYRKVLDDIFGDTAFKCPVVEIAKAYADRGKIVYAYDFNHRTSANPWPSWMGAMHGYEIDHVFGLPLNTSLRYQPKEVQLSAAIVRFWTNFAKTRDPNVDEEGNSGTAVGGGGGGNVTWPLYRLKDRLVLELDSNQLTVHKGLRDRQCDFWRDIMPKIRTHAGGGSSSSGVQMSPLISISTALASTLATLFIAKH